MPRGCWKRKVRQVVVPIGPSIAYVPLSQGVFALISSDAAIEVGRFNWQAVWEGHGSCFYVKRYIASASGGGMQPLHRFLMLAALDEGLTVDHVQPGDGLNCLPHNLRVATRAQQAANRRVTAASTSGLKGVRWRPDRNTWYALIKISGKVKYLGTFGTADEAHAAYVEAAKKYFGEFARAA